VAGLTAGFLAEVASAEHTPDGHPPVPADALRDMLSGAGGADLERLVVHRAGAAFAASSVRRGSQWLLIPCRALWASGDPAAHVAELGHVLAGAGLPRARFGLELEARDLTRRHGAAVRVHGFELAVRGPSSGRRTLGRWARMNRSELCKPVGHWAAEVRAHGTQPILDGVRGAADLLEARTSAVQLVAGPLVGQREDVPRPVANELAQALRRRPFALPPLPTPRLRSVAL